MSICFQPSDGSGTFFCDTFEELSDVVEMFRDDQAVEMQDACRKAYKNGFEDGQNAALNELAADEMAECEPPGPQPIVDPKIIIPPKTLLLPNWPAEFAA